MRIDPAETISGIPILKVREFLRRYQLGVWKTNYVMDALKVNESLANSLLAELLRQGFIQENVEMGTAGYWQTTLKGNALAGAKAGKPIYRKTAERAFVDFMKRVSEVTDTAYYLYKVKTVILFGSYLSDSLTVNDIDLVVELLAKESNARRHRELCDQRRQFLETNGKRYTNVVDYLDWPVAEVYNFLKARSRVLSIHRYDDEIWQAVKHEVVYTA